MVRFWHTLSGDSRRFGSRGYKAGDKRQKGFPFDPWARTGAGHVRSERIPVRLADAEVPAGEERGQVRVEAGTLGVPDARPRHGPPPSGPAGAPPPGPGAGPPQTAPPPPAPAAAADPARRE